MTESSYKPLNLEFVEIEPIHGDDLAVFLEENDVPAVTGTFNPFPMSAESARKIAHLPRQDRYYGALMANRIICLSMLRGWDEGYVVPSFGIIVDYRYHSLGVGSRLLEYTIRQAQALSCSQIRLTVYSSNSPAVHLYRSRGFIEQTRESVNLMGKPDEKIVMVLPLQ